MRDYAIFIRSARPDAAGALASCLKAAGFSQMRVAARDEVGDDLAWPARYAEPEVIVIDDINGGGREDY